MRPRNLFQLAVTAIVVVFAVDMTLKILNNRLAEPQGPRPPRSQGIAARETKPLSAYSKITERNIFESAALAPPEPSGEDDLNHPVTDLKLTLKGTVVGSPERSFAVIEDGRLHTQNLYHIDDTISSGVTLSAIYKDRVVINRNGRKELLLMFQETPDKGTSARPGPRVRAEAPRRVERKEIEEAVRDIKSLMRDVRIIPHFTAGERDGFTVTYVRRGSRLEELGLQKNDIIREINGTPAGEFRNIFEIFNKFSGESELTLGVERDNQLTTITYNIE